MMMIPAWRVHGQSCVWSGGGFAQARRAYLNDKHNERVLGIVMSRVSSLKDPALRGHLDGAGSRGRSRGRRSASRHGEEGVEVGRKELQEGR